MRALSPFNIDSLTALAYIWRDTPFAANAGERGQLGGVSCYLLVKELYASVGFTFDTLPYDASGRSSRDSVSSMSRWLDSCPSLQRVASGSVLHPGDLLGYKLGGTLQHLAILLPGDKIVHMISQLGVGITPRLDGTWASRHAATWRPVAFSKTLGPELRRSQRTECLLRY